MMAMTGKDGNEQRNQKKTAGLATPVVTGRRVILLLISVEPYSVVMRFFRLDRRA
jgi:hypothetical protein